MTRDIKHLFQHDYKVGAKTDGTRFYMLCSFYTLSDEREEEYIVLFDRAFHVYRISGHADAEVFNGTLLDGELVAQNEFFYNQVKSTL